MLHSEVLYDSKDYMTQVSFEYSKSHADCWRYLDQKRIFGADQKAIMWQQDVERLQEQLRVRNSEIEDLRTNHAR